MRLRWFALLLICFFVCGAYYSFDNPAELEDVLEKKFDLSVTEYSYFYSLYSFPNWILPLCAGIFIDYLGAENVLVIFSAFVTAG